MGECLENRKTLKIKKVVKETSLIKTFAFSCNMAAKPGQFLMVTDYEGGEKPFSISDCEKDKLSITVKKVGKFTSRLMKKQKGDYLSLRGPLGSSFFISQGKVLLIGGGYAVPSFYFLCKTLQKKGTNITLINGAKTKEDLLFIERFKNLGIKIYITTEDGSLGEKGTSVDRARKILQKQKFDYVYVAGPEMMMYKLMNILTDLKAEFLMERYMKCGIGICGSCTLDPLGIRLCVEGPVISLKTLKKLTEFGKYHRDSSGKRIYY